MVYHHAFIFLSVREWIHKQTMLSRNIITHRLNSPFLFILGLNDQDCLLRDSLLYHIDLKKITTDDLVQVNTKIFLVFPFKPREFSTLPVLFKSSSD